MVGEPQRVDDERSGCRGRRSNAVTSHDFDFLVTQGRKPYREGCGDVLVSVGAFSALRYSSNANIIAATSVLQIT